MKTYTARAADIQRRWHLIDAEGKTLGRLASEVAQLLKGKHKPAYTPHLDLG
ncbi:MAG: uL13 family ribosomal protein, partial [Chloroflexota bacterium]